MINKIRIKILISLFICGISTTIFAANNSSIKFFISNNTQEISIDTAYERLSGSPQDELENSTIDLLQNKHIEQGRFESVLGTYEMASDKKSTGDNTEVYFTSPKQNFSEYEIFLLARKLANTFQQESVAIFIPYSRSTISDVIVTFKSRQPGITETIKLIEDKLPGYANAFSLHLNNTYSSFNEAKVSEIEWLGSKTNIDEIKKVFPQETVSYYSGKTYLVYKNGQIQPI